MKIYSPRGFFFLPSIYHDRSFSSQVIFIFTEKAQVLRRRAQEDLRGGFRRHSRAEATRADGALR